MDQKEKSRTVPFTLRAIYLQNSHLRMGDNFDPSIPGQTLSGKFRTATGGDITCKEFLSESDAGTTFRVCTFVTRYEFRYTKANKDGIAPQEADEEANFVAEITANIAVDYLIGTPEMPSQDALQNWGKGNVLLHSWPYWREYCHASMLRMNLPVALIPMLEIKQKKVVEENLNAPPKPA